MNTSFKLLHALFLGPRTRSIALLYIPAGEIGQLCPHGHAHALTCSCSCSWPGGRPGSVAGWYERGGKESTSCTDALTLTGAPPPNRRPMSGGGRTTDSAGAAVAVRRTSPQRANLMHQPGWYQRITIGNGYSTRHPGRCIAVLTYIDSNRRLTGCPPIRATARRLLYCSMWASTTGR